MNATLSATKVGTCAVCALPIDVGDSFCWGERTGSRTHPWCHPELPEEEEPVDLEALMGEIVDELAARLQGASAETIAEMVALRLARPVEDPPLGLGRPIGTMNCSRCGATWAVSNGAAFECRVCGTGR